MRPARPSCTAPARVAAAGRMGPGRAKHAPGLWAAAEGRTRVVRYFRQNTGVNTISSVNSSRRPSSMANAHTQVWKSSSTA